MGSDITVSMITKNAAGTIEKSLRSVRGWVDKIIVVDAYSSDNTPDLAKKYGAVVYKHKYEGEGKQRNYALSKVRSGWTLVLDADEVVTTKARVEIVKKIKSLEFSGYLVPIQSYFLGRKLQFGGENYSKMILFRTKKGYSSLDEIHAIYRLRAGRIGRLKNKIDHYSYRCLSQMLAKFSSYACRQAKEKAVKGEKSSLKKIFLYPPHMFWARFFKDKGYRDGLSRLPLDLGFAYQELLTYLILLGTTFRRKLTNKRLFR